MRRMFGRVLLYLGQVTGVHQGGELGEIDCGKQGFVASPNVVERGVGVDQQAVDRVGDRVGGTRSDVHNSHRTRFVPAADVPRTGRLRSFQLPVELPGSLRSAVRDFR